MASYCPIIIIITRFRIVGEFKCSYIRTYPGRVSIKREKKKKKKCALSRYYN